MTIDVNPQNKFQIVTRPAAQPGCCYVCRNGNAAWYLDTGAYEEFFGVVYICNDCIAQMAVTVGYFTPEQRVEFEERIMQLGNELAESTARIYGMEQIINGYSALGVHNPPDVPVLSSDSPSDSLGSEGPDQDSTDSAQHGEDEMGVGEGNPPEPTNDEALGDVRPTSDPSDFKLSL